MMAKNFVVMLLVVSVVSAFAAPAYGVPIAIGDFSGSEKVIDFEDLAEGEVVADQYDSLGANFLSGNQVTEVGLASREMSVIFDEIIEFDVSVHRIGFDLTVNEAIEVYMEVYGTGGVLLDEVSLEGTGFVGSDITASGDTVTSVWIHDSGLGFNIDNVRFENPGSHPAPAVPEPATYLLLGVGLAVVGLTTRFRSRKHQREVPPAAGT